MLYGHVIPGSGSSTTWADCTAAFADLPDELKDELIDFEAIHTHPEAHMNQEGDKKGVSHPVIRKHRETGQQCLFLSPYFTHTLHGSWWRNAEQHSQLMNFLQDAVTDPQYFYEHTWSQGDMILYDNRCTNHFRKPFEGDRELWRSQAREAL